MAKERIRIESKAFEISNRDKIFFPEAGITKGDIIDYYQEIAPAMLPHMKDRPLNMQRFPNGIQENGFYEKVIPDHFPDWFDRASVELKGKSGTQVQPVCNSEAALVYLANQACLTPHLWLSRADKLDYPDRMIFDLDPSEGVETEKIRRAALDLGDLLEEIGLVPFFMTTGSKGYHLVAPLKREADFDGVRKIAKRIAQVLVARSPADEMTVESRKEKRKGKIFVDYLRNAYGQTAAAAYSVRPLPGAPVATPLDREELKSKKVEPRKYTLKNIQRRLSQKEDPWKGMDRRARSIKGPAEKIEALLDDPGKDGSS